MQKKDFSEQNFLSSVLIKGKYSKISKKILLPQIEKSKMKYSNETMFGSRGKQSSLHCSFIKVLERQFRMRGRVI